MQDSERSSWKPSYNPWLVTIVVTMATFMEVLDTTIVNVALPHIAGNLSTTYDNATWSLTSYLAANGIVLTISGWLARVLGRKRYFLICILMFTVASFLCGMSDSLQELIIFRLLQGFFGGGLQPTQQAILLDLFPPYQRSAAFGVTAVAIIVAPVLGPTLGGWITDSYSWRWVFFLNIPIGILTFFAVMALLEDPPWAKKRRERVDYIGLSLITVGLGCLEVMVDRGENEDWFGSTSICWMAFFAFIGIVGSVIWLLYTKQPVVNLRAFKDRNFSVATILMGGLGAILYSTAMVIPQFSQMVMGYTAFLSGLVLFPGSVVIILLTPAIGILINYVQIRYVIMLGFFLAGCSMIYSAQLVPYLDFTHLVVYRIAQTATLSLLFVPLSTIAYMTLPHKYNGDATALFSMIRNVLGSLSISGTTALLTETKQVKQSYLADWTSPLYQPFNAYLEHMKTVAQQLGYAAQDLDSVALKYMYQDFNKQVAILAYNHIFMIIAIIAFILVPVGLLLDGYTARKKNS